jgi:mRNA interferase MazF
MAGAVTRRGQFVVVATTGDYGKPRPALIVQSDLFAELPSVVICPLTSMLRDDADQFRLEVRLSTQNGLREVFQIAIDKITAIPAGKIGRAIGEADDALLLRVNRALALFQYRLISAGWTSQRLLLLLRS